MYYSQTVPLAIYAEAEFGRTHAKTAEGTIRYGQNPIVAVIDSTLSPQKVSDVLNVPCQAPIVASVKESLPFQPQALLLGLAKTGGQLPNQWRQDIIFALENGLDVINGLHDFLADDPEFVRIASHNNRRLIDLRRTPDDLPIGSGKARTTPAYVCLTVGSDASIGKMTTSLELKFEAVKQGWNAKFIATGQTGIMIEGEGIAIDRVIGDFMAGAVESLVLAAGDKHDLIFVEGQGSLIHPGFSGVTLATIHGACPDAMILCHKAIARPVNELTLPMPNLPELIKLYELTASVVKPAKVVGIAVNTKGLSESEAKQVIEQAAALTGLPATDVIRFGAANLLAALLQHKRSLS